MGQEVCIFLSSAGAHSLKSFVGFRPGSGRDDGGKYAQHRFSNGNKFKNAFLNM